MTTDVSLDRIQKSLGEVDARFATPEQETEHGQRRSSVV